MRSIPGGSSSGTTVRTAASTSGVVSPGKVSSRSARRAAGKWASASTTASEWPIASRCASRSPVRIGWIELSTATPLKSVPQEPVARGSLPHIRREKPVSQPGPDNLRRGQTRVRLARHGLTRAQRRSARRRGVPDPRAARRRGARLPAERPRPQPPAPAHRHDRRRRPGHREPALRRAGPLGRGPGLRRRLPRAGLQHRRDRGEAARLPRGADRRARPRRDHLPVGPGRRADLAAARPRDPGRGVRPRGRGRAGPTPCWPTTSRRCGSAATS